MRKAMVITNYTDETERELTAKVSAVIKGCKNNIHFYFAQNEHTNLVFAYKDFIKKQAAATSGNKSQLTLKRIAKKALALALKTICKELNHQHKGNEAVLLTSGAIMAKNSNNAKKGMLQMAENLKAREGHETTQLKVTVKKIKGLNNNGTAFAYTELENALENISEWTKDYCTCHRITLYRLKKGTTYLISAAYIGTNDNAYNWCKPIMATTKQL